MFIFGFETNKTISIFLIILKRLQHKMPFLLSKFKLATSKEFPFGFSQLFVLNQMITFYFKSNKKEKVQLPEFRLLMQSLIKVPCFLQSDARTAVYVPVMKRDYQPSAGLHRVLLHPRTFKIRRWRTKKRFFHGFVFHLHFGLGLQ